MKKTSLFFLAAALLAGCNASDLDEVKIAAHPKTFCNPLNLNYRFMKIRGGNGIREAADPVVSFFKGKYYLFASKSSGYWYSDNFTDWTHVFITDSVLPIEHYAPATFSHDGYLYYVASSGINAMVYRSAAPEKGEWEPVSRVKAFVDPAFYVEGNNLYLYHGCSPQNPIQVQQLDLNTLAEKSGMVDCLNSKTDIYGWERSGENNELQQRPWIEGAWMTRHNGKYYLQYATPGTQWKSYADGVYIGDTPMGPFRYMENSPVSYKPTGFIGGAGHGCLFAIGNESNYWKVATNSISIRHLFERRVSLYPAGFDKEGYLYTNTYLGDYPTFLPGNEERETKDQQPGWMLLSYRKPVTASSTIGDYPVGNIVDEDVRTAWVAAGNKENEWVQIDLQHLSAIQAIQVNFDEYGASQKGYVDGVYQSYTLQASLDGKDWHTIVDKSGKKTDDPHDYIEFESPFKARYIRFENKGYTVSNNLSLREIRVFGNGLGKEPGKVNDFTVERNQDDPCRAVLKWEKVADAQGYIVRYGIAADKLYNNFQVMEKTSLDINSLNAGVAYYFTIDTYNENGITRTSQVKKLEK